MADPTLPPKPTAAPWDAAAAAARLQPVERLEVQVLVDNVTDYLSTNPDHVRSETQCLVEHGMETMTGEAICCAHHGLSLVIKAHTAEGVRTLLFDAGPEAYGVERNGDRLGVDFGAVEAMMLSHGHWDHAGGMLAAVRLIRRARPDGELQCYLHPGMFRQRGTTLPSGQILAMSPIPQPADYHAAGAAPEVAAEGRTVLGDAFFVSGEIPRVTPYEKGLPPHLRRAEDGRGWEPDPWIMDERFLAVHVREKGLVVFSACSHAGIVNVLTEARRCFPDVPLHAAMGGFHLSGPAVEPIIPDTIRDLGGFGLRWIVPCHCTGWRAVAALLGTFGEEHVSPGAVGKRFTF
jgi:7,8-dihydropterin-6-yl-methyl-4-(beta-D-ribofuranosyl)aminobenzene 5'-phosphate synthase